MAFDKEMSEFVKGILFFVLVFILIFVGITFVGGCAEASVEINMETIKQIESGGDPHAYNKRSGARGLYQFLPIAWKDVQQHYPSLKKYEYIPYVHDPEISKIFAEKYFIILEEYLRNYGKSVTMKNILMSYNMGIGNFIIGKKFKESEEYVRKYRRYELQRM